jgi:septin family protein
VKVISDADVKRLRAICQNVNAVVPVVGKVHRSFATLRMTQLR